MEKAHMTIYKITTTHVHFADTDTTDVAEWLEDLKDEDGVVSVEAIQEDLEDHTYPDLYEAPLEADSSDVVVVELSAAEAAEFLKSQ
jgi:hypothetical protein